MAKQKADKMRVANGAFEIERGVDYPPHARRRYPFNEMEVGDSFAVSAHLVVAVRNAACQFGKHHQQTFSCRKTPDGYRLWRTA